MMTSEQLKAFKVEDEPTEVRAAYGDTPFGAGCLIARRLVEVGVRAIEVTLEMRICSHCRRCGDMTDFPNIGMNRPQPLVLGL